MNVGSLFAGIGGIEIGFEYNGFNIAWANEIDKQAVKTYRANFDTPIIHDDIKNICTDKLSDIDVLVGGFPCQAFSVAGYRKGFKDKRGCIVFEMFKVLKAKKPRVIFLENVKNLASHNDRRTLKLLINSLENIGYYIKYNILNACDYSDIPQNRERIYIVGFLNKTHYNSFSFPFSFSNKSNIIRKSISYILEENVSDEFYYNRFSFYDVLERNITKKDTFYQWRRHYVRENKSKLCPTLTANMGTGGHNVPLIKDKKGIRKLTPRECARLQGFPDSFILPKHMAKSSLYKQIGNSVSVPVISLVAKQIKKVLA